MSPSYFIVVDAVRAFVHCQNHSYTACMAQVIINLLPTGRDIYQHNLRSFSKDVSVGCRTDRPVCVPFNKRQISLHRAFDI